MTALARSWRTLITVVVLGASFWPSLALAISDPDAPLQLPVIDVYRNLLESGDQLYVAEYNIVYTATPTEPVSDTYIVRLMNGATELGVTLPYTFNDNGYGKGVVSLYFSAATITAKGMSWGQAYDVVLSGNPAFFASPPSTTVTLAAGNYTSASTQADNRAGLAATVLTLAADLGADWEEVLTTVATTGNQLNATGQVYFGTVIPNLVNMAPALYPAQTISPAFPTPQTFDRDTQDTAYNRFAGVSWLNFESAADDYGPGARWFGGLLTLVFAIAVLVLSRRVNDGDIRPGYYPAIVIILIGTWYGWVAWPIVFIGAFVVVLLTAFDFFLSRA